MLLLAEHLHAGPLFKSMGSMAWQSCALQAFLSAQLPGYSCSLRRLLMLT